MDPIWIWPCSAQCKPSSTPLSGQQRGPLPHCRWALRCALGCCCPRGAGVARGFGSTGAVLEQCGCDAGAVPKWCWPCQAEDQQREHKSAKIPPGSWGERRAQAALVCTGPLLCPVGGKSLLPGSAGTVGPPGTAPSSSSDAAGSLGHISGQIFCPPEIPARSSASLLQVFSKQTQSCARCWGGGRAAGALRAVHRSFQHR